MLASLDRYGSMLSGDCASAPVRDRASSWPRYRGAGVTDDLGRKAGFGLLLRNCVIDIPYQANAEGENGMSGRWGSERRSQLRTSRGGGCSSASGAELFQRLFTN